MLLKLKEARTSFVRETSKLDSLSPLKTLTRGYSIVSNAESGKIVKSINDLHQNDNIKIRLIDGELNGTIRDGSQWYHLFLNRTKNR